MTSNSTHSIHYRVQVDDSHAHLFGVRCSVPQPDPDGQGFWMPAWIPGSYMIRDFARHIVRLKATSRGQAVAVHKIDKHTWKCAPVDGPLSIEYQVYAWDNSVRGAYLDAQRGYFNGPCLLLAVTGQERQACSLELLRPTSKNWHVATAMDKQDVVADGFGEYRAANYDELIDHPFEMGHLDVVKFIACGVPHELVISGRHHGDLQRLSADLKRICEHHIRFFGEPAPMSRYVFLLNVVGEGYGGLEHRACSSNQCSRADLPLSSEPNDGADISNGYRKLLGLLSHEYFHSWNVKRIKPAVFEPFDLSKEVHTELLWAFEGITSYYDDLALYRTGLISLTSYLELLGQTITRVYRGAGRFRQTLAESSFDAWTRFYKQDENAPNSIVSYYTKGALFALTLDLRIRQDSDGASCLDDVMRELWKRYGQQDSTGVPEQIWPELVKEVTGLDLNECFDAALYGVDDLPLESLLGKESVALHWRAAEGDKDQGGKAGAVEMPLQPVLGARVVEHEGAAKVTHVFDGGAAQQAGLAAGDRIVALDGLRVTARTMAARLKVYSLGKRVEVHAFRRDELMVLSLPVVMAEQDTAWLEVDASRENHAWPQAGRN